MENVPPIPVIPTVPAIPQVKHEAQTQQQAIPIPNQAFQGMQGQEHIFPRTPSGDQQVGTPSYDETHEASGVGSDVPTEVRQTTSSNTKEALGIPKEFRITWIPFALSQEDAILFDAFSDHFGLKKIDVGRAWIESIFKQKIAEGIAGLPQHLLKPDYDYGVFDPNSPAVKEVKERKQRASSRSDGFGFNKMSTVKDVEKLKQVQSNVSAIGADIFNKLMLGVNAPEDKNV